ncbi:MAG TPA: YceI family protein [Bacteroidia bacterium]|jgi:polyisoprenoid-binding protein YceI|nr:YceI family protein [Bacteroidia bacterium]
MKKIIFPIAIGATLILSAFTAVNSMDWKIASGYSVKFTSKDPTGVFTSMKGDIAFDPNNLAAAKFNITIDVNSINTGNGMQNTKAKNADWFDAEKYPTIKFTSATTTKTATGYQVVGTLDMHGTQKQITIPFTFANNTFVGSFDVNRLDYGVGTDKGMSAHASSVLKIDVSVPVTQ